MFFDSQDLYIPPCCDQKFFRHLWEYLSHEKTTVIWPGNDYSFLAMFRKVTEHFPMSSIELAMPVYDANVVKEINTLMTRMWFDVKSKSNIPYLDKVTLIIPKSAVDEYSNDALELIDNAIRSRLKVCYSDMSQVVMLVKNKGEYVMSFVGTVPFVSGSSNQNVHAITVSADKYIINEVSTILRVNSHHVIKDNKKEQEPAKC